MTVITKVTQPGQKVVSTLDGSVRLESGGNRLVAGSTENGVVIGGDSLTLTKDGTVYVDGSGGNIEVKDNGGGVKGRLGYRSSDGDGAVESAKPGGTV